METYLHSFYTWALAKHGVKAGRAAGVAGAAGAAFPDIPSFVATAYYIGPVYLRDGWASMDSQEVLDAIYFTGPFGATGSALHATLPVAVLLLAYRVFGVGRRDSRGILLWFLLGWLGHTVVDFLTHVEDGRPPLWPLSDWTWSSPVSYYDPNHYGSEFALASNGIALSIMALLLVLRVSRSRRKKDPRPRERV